MPPMKNGLLYWLEGALREAREGAGKPRSHVLRFFPFDPTRKKGEGRDGSSENAILRRELHQVSGWPNNPDMLVDTYAEALGREPLELWADAVRRYAEHRGIDPAALAQMLAVLAEAETHAKRARSSKQRRSARRGKSKRNRREAPEA